ncbi:hypothetical protein [Streptomyces sp. NPDC020983]|uniref:hypothetical protein n=1 Tax=Streptomyces sp. NPDC020983 TaxID=3365106 RepID=UPI0037B47B29
MHVADGDGDGRCVGGGAVVVADGAAVVGRWVTGTVGRDAVAVGEDAVGDAVVAGGRERLADGADDVGASEGADGGSDADGEVAGAAGDVPSGTSGADGAGADSPPDSAAMESMASAPATATAPTP